MSSRSVVLAVGFTTVLALLSPATARAQDGTVQGVVTDSMGKPIPDADVAIVVLHQLTRSDSSGRFVFTKLPRGEHEVSVRRVGYTPETIKVAVNEMAYSYTVVLVPQAAVLSAMQVNAAEQRLRLGIEEFYRRRAKGLGGTFFTRDEILARNARRSSDVLRNSPGVRFVRTRSGNGIRFSGGGSSSMRRECTPVIWLDGQEVQNMEIDDIPVHDIEGIEVYTGVATTPMQFSPRQSRDECGTIVVWTRIPGKP
jgi:hypothetical protein